MAAAPTPDPTQQPGGTTTQGQQPQADPSQGGGAPSQAPAPPELMALAKLQSEIQQFSQAYPAASSGLAKASAGINEAMSAITVAGPQQQAPNMSPPY